MGLLYAYRGPQFVHIPPIWEFVTQPAIPPAVFPQHRAVRTLGLLPLLALAWASSCNPVFYPTDPTLQRRYHVLGGSETYLQTFVPKGDTITEIRRYPDRTEQTQWSCSAEGLRTLPEGDQPIPGGTVQLTKLSGVIIPSDEVWKVGGGWKYRYELKGKISVFELSGFLEVTNRILARETVEVPAGRFEALRLEASFQGQFGLPFSGKATYWFAPGVGVVKQLSEGGLGGKSLELLEFKRSSESLAPPQRPYGGAHRKGYTFG